MYAEMTLNGCVHVVKMLFESLVQAPAHPVNALPSARQRKSRWRMVEIPRVNVLRDWECIPGNVSQCPNTERAVVVYARISATARSFFFLLALVRDCSNKKPNAAHDTSIRVAISRFAFNQLAAEPATRLWRCTTNPGEDVRAMAAR